MGDYAKKEASLKYSIPDWFSVYLTDKDASISTIDNIILYIAFSVSINKCYTIYYDWFLLFSSVHGIIKPSIIFITVYRPR